MENFKKQYRDLEMRVHNELRNKIMNSTHKSIHTGTKSIKVKTPVYSELTIINERLTFLNSSGYHYSIDSVSLEDLIFMLNDNK
jgi:hypothetical protein